MTADDPRPAPRVSVNLCCYNSERFLAETLESVVAQTYRDWELVIVDDGSTDGTRAIVERQIAAGSRISYHPQPNAGLGRARQRALELSRGEFIAIIDHDDVWLPRKLEVQVALLDRHPEAAVVYADAVIVDANGAGRARYFDYGRPARGLVFDPMVRNVLPICLPTVMLRRSVAVAAGGFRPFAYAEDYDLFSRLAEVHPFEYTDEVLAKYRKHAGNFSRNLDTLYEERITILTECLARADSADAARRRSIMGELALNHAHFAVWYRRHGKREASLAEVRASLALRPRLLKPYLHCAQSLLPGGVAGMLGRVRLYVWARVVRGVLRRTLHALGRPA